MNFKVAILVGSLFGFSVGVAIETAIVSRQQQIIRDAQYLSQRLLGVCGGALNTEYR